MNNVIGYFWERVDEQLKKSGISLKFMSEGTGIKYDAFKAWRSRNRIPDPESLILISNFLSVSLDYLLSGKLPENNSEDVEVMAVKSNQNIRAVVRRCAQDPDYLKTALYIAGSVQKIT